MAIKLVALDLDGTLTDSQKLIPAANKQSLIDIQNRGIKVVLASGRPTYGIRHLADELKLSEYGGYILAYNGGYIIDCKDNTPISKMYISSEMLGELTDAANEMGVAIITYDDERDTILSAVEGNKWVEHEAWLNNNMTLKIVSVQEFVATAPAQLPKCLMVGEPDLMAQVEPQIQKRFSQLDVYRSSPFFLEIVPKGIDKAASLDMLGRKIGITAAEIAAFGDGYNDISMVKYAGLGVAMQNGCDEIKAIADYVSLSNDECGVAHAIEALKI
ncbi:MAG: HAD family phosphatase [Bacteroidales bacterium]|jgi:hypothetical protein|nr:HAD family phosphatase [Bacteroidales bacterium]